MGAPTSITTLGPSGPGNNGKEGVTQHSSRALELNTYHWIQFSVRLKALILLDFRI